MTVDKLSAVGPKLDRENAATSKTLDAQPSDFSIKNKMAALSHQNLAATVAKLPASPVSVSMAAKELFNAVHTASEDDEFDLDKVEQIRREIASGRFPIDPDRLARKFLELEQQLGDLGS